MRRGYPQITQITQIQKDREQNRTGQNRNVFNAVFKICVIGVICGQYLTSN